MGTSERRSPWKKKIIQRKVKNMCAENENKEQTTEGNNQNSPETKEEQPKNNGNKQEIISVMVTSKKSLVLYFFLLSILCPVALLSFIFFGYFFPVSGWKNIAAMGIGALTFTVLIVCVLLAFVKYIEKRDRTKKDDEINSTKILFDAYEKIFMPKPVSGKVEEKKDNKANS